MERAVLPHRSREQQPFSMQASDREDSYYTVHGCVGWRAVVLSDERR